MQKTAQTTLELIHAAAKREFLEKGFQAASLLLRRLFHTTYVLHNNIV